MNTYISLIDTHIAKTLGGKGSEQGEFPKIFMWSLDGGKRIRPSMTLDLIKTLQEQSGVVIDFTDARNNFYIDIALCIEYIHNSSLIVDDLPCMDNDTFRRGKRSVHSQFGEATAQLTAVSMLSESFKTVLQGLDAAATLCVFTRERANQIGMVLAHLLADKIGILGASGGQYLELSMIKDNYKAPSGKRIRLQQNMGIVKDYIDKKTGSFFEIAFALGYLFGGGPEDKLSRINEIARYFGTMYQITDDFEDRNKDLLRDEVTVNFVNIYGFDQARQVYASEKKSFIHKMKENGFYSTFFQDLVDKLDNKWKDIDEKISSNLKTSENETQSRFLAHK